MLLTPGNFAREAFLPQIRPRSSYIILGFKPISNRFQVSKHVIKARASCLARVDVPVEGFISKPPLAGTKLVELPTFKDPQKIVEEITSLDEEVEIESEDNTSEESIESLIRDEDFKVFYRTNETEEEASSSRLAAALISENQKATEVPQAMVIENRLPDLLSLLESYVGTTSSEIPVVPKPPMPIPLPLPQIKLAEKKWKRDKKRGKGFFEKGEV
nr:hypothetical protein CFP56_66199 [Quercus suber]